MKLILVSVFLLLGLKIRAQEVRISLTRLNQKDSIQYLSFQGETYFNLLDTLRVELKDEYANFGIMVLKFKSGYLLCDFSDFYGLKKTPEEPVEFSLYKMNDKQYRASVFTMKGADVFWECRFLPEINVFPKKVKIVKP